MSSFLIFTAFTYIVYPAHLSCSFLGLYLCQRYGPRCKRSTLGGQEVKVQGHTRLGGGTLFSACLSDRPSVTNLYTKRTKILL